MKISHKATTFLMGAFLITSLNSCATIVNGSRQQVGITSRPANASVWVDSNYAGFTPIIVEMTRKDNHIVHIELEGFQPYDATFCRQMSGWVFGNIVFGGLIGIAVDAVSGGIYKLSPEQVQAELNPNQMALSKKSKDSFITIVLKPNPSWEKVGNLVAVK